MTKTALGCLVDGFDGPESLNIKSLKTISKLANLYRFLIELGDDVEIWITKSVVVYPGGNIPLYQIMRRRLLLEGLPESCLRVTDLPAYNALTDGATFADYAKNHPVDNYIFLVPNFHFYFLLTYKAMRKHLGDGQNWENISVTSTYRTASLRVSLLYGILILITMVASQNKWLWKQWFNVRAREKTKRESGFISTVS